MGKPDDAVWPLSHRYWGGQWKRHALVKTMTSSHKRWLRAELPLCCAVTLSTRHSFLIFFGVQRKWSYLSILGPGCRLVVARCADNSDTCNKTPLNCNKLQQCNFLACDLRRHWQVPSEDVVICLCACSHHTRKVDEGSKVSSLKVWLASKTASQPRLLQSGCKREDGY